MPTISENVQFSKENTEENFKIISNDELSWSDPEYQLSFKFRKVRKR